MENLKELSTLELEQLLKERKKNEHIARIQQRDAYEAIRAQVVHGIKEKVMSAEKDIADLFDYVSGETEGFRQVMQDYGQFRRENQQSFTIKDGDFKIEVASNKVKKFDERADIAAARLIDFLTNYMKNSTKGVNDPMYQLAMTLLERNKQGELDYKSISKLYGLEDKFNDPEYYEIMQLFKESNVIEGTAINYYFSKMDARGIWRRVEISFNRL